MWPSTCTRHVVWALAASICAKPVLAVEDLLFYEDMTYAEYRRAARALNYSVRVASASEWYNMTSDDFAQYKAIIVPDPDCGTLNKIQFLNDTKSAWTPAVSGNVIVIGTDTSYHAATRRGAVRLIDDAIRFAAAGASTGLYLSLSCYYNNDETATVDVLSEMGVFEVRGRLGCYEDVHLVATADQNTSSPQLNTITDSALSNWECSAHELITSYPSTGANAFVPVAIITDAAASLANSESPNTDGLVQFADNSSGIPYIVARGVTPIGCGDGIVESVFGEECDHGVGNNGAPGNSCSESCRCINGIQSPGGPCANVTAPTTSTVPPFTNTSMPSGPVRSGNQTATSTFSTNSTTTSSLFTPSTSILLANSTSTLPWPSSTSWANSTAPLTTAPSSFNSTMTLLPSAPPSANSSASSTSTFFSTAPLNTTLGSWNSTTSTSTTSNTTSPMTAVSSTTTSSAMWSNATTASSTAFTNTSAPSSTANATTTTQWNTTASLTTSSLTPTFSTNTTSSTWSNTTLVPVTTASSSTWPNSTSATVPANTTSTSITDPVTTSVNTTSSAPYTNTTVSTTGSSSIANATTVSTTANMTTATPTNSSSATISSSTSSEEASTTSTPSTTPSTTYSYPSTSTPSTWGYDTPTMPTSTPTTTLSTVPTSTATCGAYIGIIITTIIDVVEVCQDGAETITLTTKTEAVTKTVCISTLPPQVSTTEPATAGSETPHLSHYAGRDLTSTLSAFPIDRIVTTWYVTSTRTHRLQKTSVEASEDVQPTQDFVAKELADPEEIESLVPASTSVSATKVPYAPTTSPGSYATATVVSSGSARGSILSAWMAVCACLAMVV